MPITTHRFVSSYAGHAFTALLVCSAVLTATSSVAHAQGAPVFPTILDVHQAKLGSWGQYEVKMPNVEMKQRMAIISRDENSTTIEMSVEGGPMQQMGSMLIQVKIPRDPKLESRPAGIVMQVGKNTPMEMPADHPMVPKESFKRLQVKDLDAKVETVKVAGGTFQSRRHTQKRGEDEAITWLSEKATPLGLVKMQSKTPMGPATVELLRMGSGAKSNLNGKPVPFDQNLFMKQVMSGMSGGKK
jgi:hypothetical protein